MKNFASEWARQRAVLKPGHPYMQRLDRQLEQLKVQLRHQLELIEEKRLARIASLTADEQSYQPLILELRQQVLASRNVQYEFERLKEEEANIKSVLGNLRKAEESLNSTTTEEGLLTVIEEGRGSPVAIRPNRARMILAGLVMGLGAGLALIYLLGRLDDRLELAEEIEAELEQPVLGQIPQLDTEHLRQGRALISNLEDHHLFAESLRSVRSAVLLSKQERPPRVLMMSSAVPGDGKTTFTVNFAIALAIAGQRVLLVDADLRRGDTHNFFGHSREPGLSDVLTGQLHWAEAKQETPVKTLQVIHSGPLPANPGELLIGPIVSEFVKEAQQEYDFVLFDCPPLTTIDDSFALVHLVDGLVFVVRSGQTSMRFAKAALEAVHKRGINVLGFVLNGIKADNPYYYYKHYYYSYYSHDQPIVPDSESAPKPALKMARRKEVSSAAATPPAGPDVVPTPSAENQIISLGSFPEPPTDDHDQSWPQSGTA